MSCAVIPVTLALAWSVTVASPNPGHVNASVDSARVGTNDNRVPAGELRSGVLTLRLVARVGFWRPEGAQGPEIPIYAFAEEVAGRTPQIPGPLIRVPVGTEVRASIRNSLPQALRIYGMQDRPGGSIDSVELVPGEIKQIRFRAGAPGTYLYWGRTSRDTFTIGQLEDGQLHGAIVVDSARDARAPNERVFVLGLWKARDTPPGTPTELREETLVFNGLAWPHSERLTHTVGDTIRWRVVNATRRAHPLHLHGFYFRVDARGTAVRDTVYTPAQQRLAVTERLLPTTSMSITWSPHTAGNWLFHCHLVEHISAKIDPASRRKPGGIAHANHALEGMSGLVLGIAVRPRAGASTVRQENTPRRSLRLFATERPRTFGDLSAYSFVLQEGAGEPAADSLRSPGSPIVLTRGEPAAITVLNRMRDPLAVHWHGIELESYYDGVSGWSGAGTRVAPSIAPGDSFVVRLTPPRAGTFIYHTHHNETRQLGAGLFGPLIVLEPGEVRDTVTDRVLLMAAGGPFPNSPPGFNGATTPTPIELRAGVTYRLRFISIASHDTKAVRLLADSGLVRWRPIGKDGAALPEHQATMQPARLLMGTGETWDVEFTPAALQELTLEIVSSGRVALPPVRTLVLVRVRAP